jgi:hypothetical protein
VPPRFGHVIEEQNPNRVGHIDGLRFRNLVFESTPLSLFDAVYTENGGLTSNVLAGIRARLAAAEIP